MAWIGFAAALRAALAGLYALAILPGQSLAQAAAPGPPLVAAASDLQFALTEIAAAFRLESGREVRLTFGSSGNFARQIRQNAPFEVYFSADEVYVEALHAEGLTRDTGQVYGSGRIVLLVPHGSRVALDGTLSDLAAALVDGRLTRLAIANPEHAPYGKRAEEALRKKGLWARVEPRLVLGENVTQAAQFVTSGNASAGIVAYSLALSPSIASRAAHALVPTELHAPLRQRMVLTRRAGPAAETFFTFCASPMARAILAKYGFEVP